MIYALIVCFYVQPPGVCPVYSGIELPGFGFLVLSVLSFKYKSSAFLYDPGKYMELQAGFASQRYSIKRGPAEEPQSLFIFHTFKYIYQIASVAES